MAKIVLGKKPETIKVTAKFKLPDGETGVLKMTCVYKTKLESMAYFSGEKTKAAEEFGKYQKAVMAAAEGKDTDIPEFDPMAWVNDVHKTHASLLAGLIKEWDIEAEVNEENISQLLDEVAASGPAIVAAYREAVEQGKLGN